MLAGAGATVAVCGRRKDRLDALVAEIDEAGGDALAVECDISDEASAKDFIARATDHFGGLYGLVNSAGLQHISPIRDGDGEDWRDMFAVNCLGMLYCCGAALVPFAEAGEGHIVNVSSLAAREPAGVAAVYTMTKFAMSGFTKALREEAGGVGTRVTLIEPGMIDTEFFDHLAPEIRAGVEQVRQAIGRTLQPDDIAAAILHAMTAPAYVSVDEILLRPFGQAGPTTGT
jgi:NADP-dependent 3-hydroxy acid dehydrogenase YdfG